jgi:hypothetical protein
MTKIRFIFVLAVLAIGVYAQKTVVLDISHEQKQQYLNVNPQMFEQYSEVVEKILGARLVINEDRELDDPFLAQVDVLIIPSPLTKETQKHLTPTERKSIVDYVKKGRKLIFFTDEDRRMDVDAFGGNDIVRPFGMEFGGDLPRLASTAVSFVGEVFKGKYEVPYVGSRELTGGIPLSVKNSEGGYVHGAYTKLDNGGTIAAFGETMVGLFLGGVENTRPDGSTVVWAGKDNKQFMQELIGWMLK